MEFCERMRAARKGKGLKQAELAERAGISINSVRLYEAGKRSPTLETVYKIAAVLGVPVESLVSSAKPDKRIHIVSAARMPDIILWPKQNEPALYLCLDYTSDGKGITLAAIDNTTFEAWTEKFDNIPDAVSWLRRSCADLQRNM